jgi:phosphatidylserine/phosphatidylglycerophosphate/cardiolipin synthase-like enzyme
MALSAPAPNIDPEDVGSGLPTWLKPTGRSFKRSCGPPIAASRCASISTAPNLSREPAKVFNDLAETPTVEIRTKRDHAAPMHLKSYQIDGRLLRTGAANFSASGLKRHDLIVIESAGAAAGPSLRQTGHRTRTNKRPPQRSIRSDP